MTSIIVPHGNSQYNAEQIERGLIALAMESGNAKRACTLLKKGTAGDPWSKYPTSKTIEEWQAKYADRFNEIRAEVVPLVKARLADVHTDLAQSLADLEARTLESLEGELDELSAKDRINLVRNAAIAGAVHVDKAQLLRGEATHIVKRELPEIVRALAAKGVYIEGTATEIDEPAAIPSSVSDK
jgi:hypothetical protein